MRAHGAKLALSFTTSTKFRDPCDVLESLIVVHVPPLMLIIAYNALYTNSFTLGDRKDTSLPISRTYARR